MKTTTSLLVQCCVCRRVRQGESWRRRNVPTGVGVSHGYCPVCLAGLMGQVRRWSPSAR